MYLARIISRGAIICSQLNPRKIHRLQIESQDYLMYISNNPSLYIMQKQINKSETIWPHRKSSTAILICNCIQSRRFSTSRLTFLLSLDSSPQPYIFLIILSYTSYPLSQQLSRRSPKHIDTRKLFRAITSVEFFNARNRKSWNRCIREDRFFLCKVLLSS